MKKKLYRIKNWIVYWIDAMSDGSGVIRVAYFEEEIRAYQFARKHETDYYPNVR